MNYKRIIPDAITSCNLLCGSMSVYMATQYEFKWAFLFILAGAFFDFFDGLSARLLKAPSPIGIQLDSLADDITFGLAPSMMLFCFFWGGICCMPVAVIAYDWMAWVLIGLSLLSCYLLNAEIPFFSFKSFKKEKMTIILFLVGCLILIGFCVWKAIATRHIEFALFSGTACILWYVILNLLLACVKKK